MNLILLEKLESNLDSSDSVPFKYRNELLSSLGMGIQYFKKPATTLWYPIIGTGYLKRLAISLYYYVPESNKGNIERDYLKALSLFLEGEIPLELMEEYCFELSDQQFTNNHRMILCFLSYQVIRDSIRDLSYREPTSSQEHSLESSDIAFHLALQSHNKSLFWREWIRLVKKANSVSSKAHIQLILHGLL